MASAVREVTRRHGIETARLDAVVMHAGNGRMPALLARRLGLPRRRVRSQTAQTGNLGSASLPVAWASQRGELSEASQRRLVAWTAAAAGLQWGAALWASR
jgi:3-oxoacyl-[acyl-carrier-protein] synthase III